MKGRLFIAVIAAILATSFTSPIKQTENKPPELLPALDAYVAWSEAVTAKFEYDDVTSLEIQEFEEQGQGLHNTLMAAIDHKLTDLDAELDKDIWKNVLASLEEETIGANVNTDKMLGLILGDEEVANHGARLAVASNLFSRLSSRLRTSVEESRDEMDAEHVNKIVEEVTALEIIFDAVITNFRQVEDLVLVDDNSDDSGNDVSDLDNDNNDHLSRQKRRANDLDLGGGFSTNGRSITYTRGRTSVSATPHFSLRPKPQFHGATLGAEHRFSSRNGRVNGAVFGSATVNSRGRPTGGQIGIRINF